MSDPKSAPADFLKEAAEVLGRRDADRLELRRLKDENSRQEKELSHLRSAIEKEKKQIVDDRRNTLSSEYDRQLKLIASNIRSINDKRKKARSKGVKNRIKEETADLTKERDVRRKELKKTVSDAKLPAYSRSRLYYILFMPRGIKEISLAVLCFIVVFIVLPFLLMFFIPGQSIWKNLLIFAVIVFGFGGLYMYVLHRTKFRSPDGIKAARKLMSDINDDELKIRRMKSQIRRDKDDGAYDLGAFDDELTDLEEKRTVLERKKEEALSDFEAVTRDILMDEVNEKYRSRLEELGNEVKSRIEHINSVEKKLSEEELSLQSYTQYIGSENMDQEKLQRLEAMLRSNEAASITEAINRLKEAKPA